jgi:hypothetical protein
MSGADTILSPTTNKAFWQRVHLAAAKFLEDGNLNTTHHDQELIKFLIKENENFESVFYSEVDSNTSEKTGKIITSLCPAVRCRRKWSPVRKGHTIISILRDGLLHYDSVTWPLKARIVRPQKTSLARQRLGKHIPAAMDMHATIEDLLEVVSSIRPVPKFYKEWPVAVKPFLSSKRRPHFKTRKSLGKSKIWPWVQTGPKTMIDYPGEGQQQFTRPTNH